ncbi:hypothetical protein O1611_g4643 [Lasiodiplodia mahajangana]|uniref:Uncharacterized protein n=1 Tax=Lasiodiplodia mahajangana TaxID=1108764 RepID=A0ACC2JNA3_9PEZI|nr:hypothetical protein O1611_g4643 [Lasiodiplodia mahajangana]
MKSHITKVTTWPFRATYRAWNDFRNGRQARKDQENKREAQEEQTAFPETERSCRETSQLPESHQDEATEDRRRACERGEWVRQQGEYPFRIEQLVHLDDNTRGTWVLEVKDMFAIVWERDYRMEESMLREETVPQPHWPFPRQLLRDDIAKRDPDELLNWLCR